MSWRKLRGNCAEVFNWFENAFILILILAFSVFKLCVSSSNSIDASNTEELSGVVANESKRPALLPPLFTTLAITEPKDIIDC